MFCHHDEGVDMVVELDLMVDRRSPVPLYHQLATTIDAAIDSGALKPGDFLENEVAMAARLGISRPTARQAIQELVDRGRLIRKRGVGTQVVSPKIQRPVKLTSLFEDLSAAGRVVRTEVLSYEESTATEDVAQWLEIPVGETIIALQRLRWADEEPLAVMSNYLPPELAPTAEELERDGLYRRLAARGARPHVARQRIGARVATTGEAEMLREPKGAPLLTMERIAYDESGSVIELGRHIYRASRYMFDTILSAK